MLLLFYYILYKMEEITYSMLMEVKSKDRIVGRPFCSFRCNKALFTKKEIDVDVEKIKGLVMGRDNRDRQEGKGNRDRQEGKGNRDRKSGKNHTEGGDEKHSYQDTSITVIS
jgi:hypothetical protein